MAPQYGNLEVKYSGGDPRITCYDANDIAIEKASLVDLDEEGLAKLLSSKGIYKKTTN